jgi:HEPN domain-containing protein
MRESVRQRAVETLMNAKQQRETVQRMSASAIDRLADATLLQRNLSTVSDSGYLLELLAFEILLKALVLLNGHAPDRTHSYLELFRLLPDPVQDRVREKAVTRMTTSADYSSLPDLLQDFATNFTLLRYPYEAYAGVSEEAVKAAGRGWLAKDAPLSEAVFVYHPEELTGLLFALTSEVDAWLDTAGYSPPLAGS